MRKPRKVAILVTVLLMVLFAGVVCCEAKEGPPSGEAALELMYRKVDIGNRQIEEAVEQAQKRAEDPDQVDRAIEWLLSYVERIADDTIEFAAKRKITVECKKEPRIIGGVEVLIDPMKVAGY
mgnify:FL=1|jgi:hypothetical protein